MNPNDMTSKGGHFILEDTPFEKVFTPEDFTDEHKMIANMTADFISGEIEPYDEEIEKQNFPLLIQLLRKAGELGLLGAEVPERYGGSDLDKISATLITEQLSRGSSYILSHGAHVGIGSLPIVLFGTHEQKQRYLPLLATGEKLAAYCLTEPSSGSDALGAKTTAVLSEDKTCYILNGTKQFITNAAFADVFVVYAKIDGKHFSAFIVEKDYPGVSTGPEEKKMGIKGSSTRPLILEDVKVPVENLLGEAGKGHVIAFNILNIGRYKLAAGCVGASKWTLELSASYAKERKQFGKPISEFPLIQKKLAEMAIQTYVTESMVYRTGGLIEAAMQQLDQSAADDSLKIAKAIEEYALECSINKVYASEALDFIADEGVQIHGGYGYTQDYKVERIYRDSRINRIFEGTNEINRLLIPATLLKKAMKGEIPLLAITKNLQEELISFIPPVLDDEETLAKETAMLDCAKKIFLMAAGTAVMHYQQKLEEEQEILEGLANLIIKLFAMESTLLRTKKAVARDGKSKSEQKLAITTAYIHEAFTRIESIAKETLTSVLEGDALLMQLSVLKKLVRFKSINLVPLKRQMAQKIIQHGKYVT